MSELIDNYCEECGSTLEDPEYGASTLTVDPAAPTRCGNPGCGSVGERLSIHWYSHELKALVKREWTESELDSFRRDPKVGVETMLNPLLSRRGMGRVTLLDSGKGFRLHLDS